MLIAGAMIWLFLIDAERPMMSELTTEGLLAGTT